MITKTADQFLKIHPWKIIEQDFHPDHSEVSESLFSLGNEYQGVRGFFDEGFSGAHLTGVYLNNIHEQRFTEGSAYRGISNRLSFMVNTVNWLSTLIELEDEKLDLQCSKFSNFSRELDFRTGELRREFIWETHTGKKLKLTFSRILSMRTKELVFQKIEFLPLNFSGRIQFESRLDFSVPHRSFTHNFWTCPCMGPGAILGITESTHQLLFAGMKIHFPGDFTETRGEKYIGGKADIELIEGVETSIEKKVILIFTSKAQTDTNSFWKSGLTQSDRSVQNYDEILKENQDYWSDFWSKSDIQIDGDEETQQGIRFCIFQMQQTYRGVVNGANIGAKGLTGEAYNGNAFWDTETYCLPFYLFSHPEAAKALLDFRYLTLPQAKERAASLDCAGACYPIATSDGTESCTLWQHASLQFQPTTAVAYAIWHYVKITDDREFLADKGAEMLVEICRFLATRGQWSPQNKFGYYAVMGPDEFQMMVNNNAYTNYMAKRTFEYTLEVMKEFDPENYGVQPGELAEWERMAREMILPYDSGTGLFEEHEGFFNLPHIAISSIPVNEFPLYSHWSYDRIYRNDIIKQPDVLMFMFLYNQSFSEAEKRANYNYYEPRCIHESSLSPSVHSILAEELGLTQEAFDFFRFATRIDLDNYNRNTAEGIHTTSIAAAWMNIIYGFGGLRSDGDLLVFNPSIPQKWNGYRFQIFYKGARIHVEVDQEQARIYLTEGPAIKVKIKDQIYQLDQQGICLKY